ncbi:hypothetical protein [Actinomyces gaoshouyii]|uniref:hypothetical protein n=1 Tax=Actinomyces gaoshouyii TaxID=1960083 RepID=UPI000F79D6AA|nr:hypothetical protein [Actinomyces gaoshouyii]
MPPQSCEEPLCHCRDVSCCGPAAAAALTAAGAYVLAGCSDDGSGGGGQAQVPEDWAQEVMEPLTIPLPAAMSLFAQESRSTDFYWDRCWTTSATEIPTSDLVLARLWGPGAEDNASVTLGVASLGQIVGGDVTVGEVKENDGGSRQSLTSSAGAGSGAVWSLTNGFTAAVVVLFGPSVDEDMIASFDAGLTLADEPALAAPAEGWQRRQAAGLSLLVGESWNDVGRPEKRNGANPWTRAWTNRIPTEPQCAVMAGDGLTGASLSEAVTGFLNDPGLTALRDSAVSAFSNDSLEGQRVDFLWSWDGDFPGCMWVVRDGDVNRAVILMRWEASGDLAQYRAAVEAGLTLL